ncbi:MAG: HDIG domain-containing protein [Candidatus Marinimicrobia bacterium]|nr:HDIG domain-containing protein [Candidatus Neomarinimicrobiota bacterium]
MPNLSFLTTKDPDRLDPQSAKRRKFWALFWCVAIIVIIALLFPKNRYSEYNYKINDITRSAVIAPFDYPILKSETELSNDRNDALKKIHFVFLQNNDIQRTELSNLEIFFKDIEKVRSAKKKYEDSIRLLDRYRYSKRYDEILSMTQTDSISYSNLATYLQENYQFEENSIVYTQLILNLENQKDNVSFPFNFYPLLRQILSNLYAQLILDISKEQIISDRIAISQNNEELLVDYDQLLTLKEAWTKAKLTLQAKYPEQDSKFINTGYEIIVKFLKPNLIYHKEKTESRQQEAINKVPISKGIILENEKIVDANTKITPEIYRKLESLSKDRARRANIRGGLRKSLPLIGDPIIFIGQILLVSIIASFFITFLLSYRRSILRDPKMVVLLGIIFVIQSLFTLFFVQKFNISEFAIPITIAAMTLTILFDSKIAFVGAATITMIVGAQLQGSLNFIITSVFVNSFAIYSVRKLRKRSQLFQSIIYILLGYLIAISVTELLKYSSIQEMTNDLLYAGINGILSPFLTYGIISLLEGIFGITTDLTLLELADFNHPLLKSLSKEATGTFTHSVTVGNLAEAAADTVGTNALRARVGAYYHDIGKITKPEYFVENQSYNINKHDNLAPNLSALIIINHIKEGIRLAKEYKLPKAIIDFISTHHGTTRVEFFYNKAMEQSDGDTLINESDFQYPGPKPHTKETGVLMICESIEAASRSLEKPTVGNIEKIIDQIIEKRLKEGQLDECPLTLADLSKIKGDIKSNTGIMPILKGLHHLRVEYPGQEKEIPSKPAKAKSKQPGT